MYNTYFGKKQITINVIGEEGVGKSTFINSIFNHTFDENQVFNESTLQSSNTYTFQKGKCIFDIQFIETDGTTLILNENYKYDGFIVLFSLIDENSFNNLNYFLDLYKYNLNNNYCNKYQNIIIGGTKSDKSNQILPNYKEIESLKIPYFEFFSGDIDSIHNILSILLDPISKKEEILIKQNERLLKSIDKSQKRETLKNKIKKSLIPSNVFLNLFSNNKSKD